MYYETPKLEIESWNDTDVVRTSWNPDGDVGDLF